MKIPTLYVFPDEYAWGLREEARLMPGPNGLRLRWVQTVFVLRGDAIASYTTDFGPAENFARVTPIYIPSTGEDDTVAQLQEIAERNRHDDYWRKRSEEMLAGSTLVQDHVRQLEIQREFARRYPRTAKELAHAKR